MRLLTLTLCGLYSTLLSWPGQQLLLSFAYEIEKCVYNDTGMFWYFGKINSSLHRTARASLTTSGYTTMSSIWLQSTREGRNSSCIRNKIDSTLVCQFFTYSDPRVHDLLSGKIGPYTERFFIYEQITTSKLLVNSTQTTLLNDFTFLFDRCHLLNCVGVMQKALIKRITLDRDKFDVHLADKRKEREATYLTTVKNSQTGKVEVYNGVASQNVIPVKNFCAAYQICKITKWNYCKEITSSLPVSVLVNSSRLPVNLLVNSTQVNSMELSHCLNKKVDVGQISHLSCQITKDTANKLFILTTSFAPERREGLFTEEDVVFNISSGNNFLLTKRSSNISFNSSFFQLPITLTASRKGCRKSTQCKVNDQLSDDNAKAILTPIIAVLGGVACLLLILSCFLLCKFRRFRQIIKADDVMDDTVSVIMPLPKAVSYTEIPETAHLYVDVSKVYGDGNVIEMDAYGDGKVLYGEK